MDRQTAVVDGVTYVLFGPDNEHRYAACCGNATCTSECKAVIHHGPGHQSRTHCHVKGEHDVHEAVYGSFRQVATWRGNEVFSGFFDEPPAEDD